MKIYTRRGDEGETGLFGGERVSKADPAVEAYGTLDELNAALGVALSLARSSDVAGPLLDEGRLERLQGDLFTIGARLAAADPTEQLEKGSIPELLPSRVSDLEGWIDTLEEELPSLDAFLLPGGHPVGAQLHLARTVCRRAERATVRLVADDPDLVEAVLPYLNRLSDLLFVLARSVNRRAGETETEWEPVRRRRDRPAPSGEEAGDGAGDGGEGADVVEGPATGGGGGEPQA